MRFWASLFVGFALGILPAADAWSESSGSLIRRAQAAIERGDVDVARDLAPLVAALRRARGGGRDELISAIEKLGGYDGASPSNAKAYLQQEAPPVLLEIGQGKGDWTVRSKALMALRSLNASDEFLDRAIAIAEADTSKQARYFHSRGQLLRSWKASRPQPPAASRAAGPTDPARERRALALLRARGLGASAMQLETSAREGDADVVEALLDTGLAADTRGLGGSALESATSLGCMIAPGNVDGRVRTVQLLITRGADVRIADNLGNTVLLGAARSCPVAVVRALVEAGASVAAVNKMGMAPLSMAFLGNNWEVAEFLIDRGARLKKADVDALFFELPTDSRKRAVIRRATAK